jgi:hypothetical protein
MSSGQSGRQPPPSFAAWIQRDWRRKKEEFQVMLDEGVIRCSSSQWSSPPHMVRKKDGFWQPCGDYHQLNLQTVENKYPLPNMSDLAARLDGCNIFS